MVLISININPIQLLNEGNIFSKQRRQAIFVSSIARRHEKDNRHNCYNRFCFASPGTNCIICRKPANEFITE